MGVASLISGLPLYGKSAVGEFRVFLFTLLFFITRSLVDSYDRLRAVFYTVLAAAFVICLHAIYNLFFSGYSASTFVHMRFRLISGDHGMYAAFIFAAVIMLLLYRKIPVYQRSAAIITLILMVVLMIVSAKRSLWLAFAATVLVFFIFGGTTIRRKGSVYMIIGILLAALVVFTANIFISEGVEQPFVESVKQISRYKTDPTANWRLQIWEQVYETAGKNPLIGQPMGSYYEFYVQGIHYERLQTHNSYLDLFTKVGFIGLGFLLMIMVVYLIQTVRYLWKYPRRTWDIVILKALAFCLVINLIYNFFNEGAYYFHVGVMIWVTLGIGANVMQKVTGNEDRS
jgi:O-antigen ligase